MAKTKGSLRKENILEEDDIKLIEQVGPQIEGNPAETALTIIEEDANKDPWTGLTQRQRQIQQLKMRGLSQAVIGKLCGGISQTMVAKELKTIREVHKQRGVLLDKEAYVGESISFYEELLIKAMNVFHNIPSDNPFSFQTKLQALNTLATIKDKHTKLLLELGMIDKTPIKHEHNLKVSGPTVVDSWSDEKRQKVAEAMLLADLEELPEPVPDDNIVDAEIEDET